MKKWISILIFICLVACRPSLKLVTITFQTNGGQLFENIEIEEGKSTSLPTPSKIGYTFDGWQSQDDVFHNTGIFYHDTILNARWKAIHYEVSFYGYQGELLVKQNVRHGQNATPPSIPQTDGYNFLAWDQPFTNIVAPLQIHPLYEGYTPGLEFSLMDDYYVVTNYTGTASEVFIPATINNIPVKKIGAKAFYENNLLTNVHLPSSIMQIENEAFYNCLYLEEINLPLVLDSIDEMAFYSCENLTTITVSAKIIGEGAFHSCTNIYSITLLNTVQTLERYAFYNCSSLQSITFPASISSLGDHIFSWSQRLTTVYTPLENVLTLQEMFNKITQIYLHKNFHVEAENN